MAQKGISTFLKLIGIIIVIAIILAVLSTFVVVKSGISGINSQNAWNDGCQIVITRDCPISAFQTPEEGGGLFIANYDPKNDDSRDPITKASKCSASTLKSAGCSDNTLRGACEETQGVKGAEACRDRCCI